MGPPMAKGFTSVFISGFHTRGGGGGRGGEIPSVKILRGGKYMK